VSGTEADRARNRLYKENFMSNYFKGIIGLSADLVTLLTPLTSIPIVGKVLFAIAIGIASFLLFFKNIFVMLQMITKMGIKGIYQENDAHKILKNYNRRIENIKIIVISGDVLIQHMNDIIFNAITKDKAKIEILLATKNSKLVKELGVLESRNGQINHDIDNTLSRIENISTSAEKYKQENNAIIGTIEVKHFNTQVRSAIIIVNDEWAWLSLYFPSLDTGHPFSLELIKKGKNPLITHCIKHFDSIWEQVTLKKQENKDE
jgi:hypothetical protein